jgi:hypothetical protein
MIEMAIKRKAKPRVCIHQLVKIVGRMECCDCGAKFGKGKLYIKNTELAKWEVSDEQ